MGVKSRSARPSRALESRNGSRIFEGPGTRQPSRRVWRSPGAPATRSISLQRRSAENAGPSSSKTSATNPLDWSRVMSGDSQ